MIGVAQATSAVDPNFGRWVEVRFRIAVYLATAVYVASILVWGAGTDEAIGARSYGMFAVYGVGLELALWRYGRKAALFRAFLITVVIGLSESRLALGIAISLFPLSQIPRARSQRWVRMFAVAGVAIVLSYTAFSYFDSLRDRFLKGDVSMNLGLVEINASGRTAFWRAAMESYAEEPVVGKGAGSAEELIESFFVTIKHPHNDYLRIIHDYGAIGAVLFTAAVASLLRSGFSDWRNADLRGGYRARVSCAALLAAVSFLLEMTMENTMVIVYVTAPLGLLIGAAARRDRVAICPSPHGLDSRRALVESR
jgi:O-antigen ligase